MTSSGTQNVRQLHYFLRSKKPNRWFGFSSDSAQTKRVALSTWRFSGRNDSRWEVHQKLDRTQFSCIKMCSLYSLVILSILCKAVLNEFNTGSLKWRLMKTSASKVFCWQRLDSKVWSAHKYCKAFQRKIRFQRRIWNPQPGNYFPLQRTQMGCCEPVFLNGVDLLQFQMDRGFLDERAEYVIQDPDFGECFVWRDITCIHH